MKARILIICLLFFGVSTAYAAQGDNYGGLQYALVTYDEDGFDEVEPTALVGRIGQFVTDNFAVEGRLGFGLQDDSIDIGPFEVDVEVDNLFGIYGVVQSSTDNDFNIYGILGFTRGELEASIGDISVSDDESGLSYGVGLNYKLFNIEYISYLDEDEFDVTALSIGFVTRF